MQDSPSTGSASLEYCDWMKVLHRDHLSSNSAPGSISHGQWRILCNLAIAFQQFHPYYFKYEEDMDRVRYHGPKWAADAVASLGLGKEARILDVLAGSGMFAKNLRELGYENIDALDGDGKTLENGQKAGLFKNIHHTLVLPSGIENSPKGGFCVWLRMEYPEADSLKNFKGVLDELVHEKVIEEMRRGPQPDYILGKEGMIHIIRRLK